MLRHLASDPIQELCEFTFVAININAFQQSNTTSVYLYIVSNIAFERCSPRSNEWVLTSKTECYKTSIGLQRDQLQGSTIWSRQPPKIWKPIWTKLYNSTQIVTKIRFNKYGDLSHCFVLYIFSSFRLALGGLLIFIDCAILLVNSTPSTLATLDDFSVSRGSKFFILSVDVVWCLFGFLVSGLLALALSRCFWHNLVL